ncbi:MAG: ribosome recycling factor [Candidatus Paceibacterota bacterium]
MAYNFAQFKEKLKETEEWLKKELSSVRTGRATPVILDSISVEAYGAKMPLNQVANIVVEDAKTIRVAPWDAGQIKAIEKAVIVSNLGLSVSVDDKGLRIIFPELTAERRGILIKLVKEKLEDAKIALRSEREEVWNDIQKKEKEGSISEDEKFRLKDDMQKIADEFSKKLLELSERKEKEVSEK